MEVINQQKSKITRLEDEYKKEQTKRRTMFESLNMTEKEKIVKGTNYELLEKENRQLKMLYTQEASAKTALHREKEILSKKVESKKDKLNLTVQQLEATIKQLDQMRQDNIQLGQVISTIKENMQSRNKGDLQSDIIFSNNMDELIRSTDKMSGIIRNSMNPNAIRNSMNPNGVNFANSQSNIKKSIRGGAGQGSMYQKKRLGSN